MSIAWCFRKLGAIKMTTAVGEVHGNFDMGTFFGDVRCIHGHKTRLFNVGRGHYVACDRCRSFIRVGENLMSCWRQENQDIWNHNLASIEGYKEVG